MILDTIANAPQYAALPGTLKRALEFIARPDLAAMKPGTHEIEGTRLYVVIARSQGKGRSGARLEAHRKYIDIQVPLDRPEVIGWKPACFCKQVAQRYDKAKDIVFFADPVEQWITVEPGRFIIFFPHDAHAPLAIDGTIHKAVVKVAIGLK